MLTSDRITFCKSSSRKRKSSDEKDFSPNNLFDKLRARGKCKNK